MILAVHALQFAPDVRGYRPPHVKDKLVQHSVPNGADTLNCQPSGFEGDDRRRLFSLVWTYWEPVGEGVRNDEHLRKDHLDSACHRLNVTLLLWMRVLLCDRMCLRGITYT